MAVVTAAWRSLSGMLVLVALAAPALAGTSPPRGANDDGAAETPAAEEAGQDKEAGSLPEVVVTATRRETLLSEAPDVVQVVTRREIEEINPPSTGKLLEFVTGATVETGTGSGLPKRSVIGLNGLPPNYTLVLIDGVRLLSEHIHTGQNLEMIPPQAIERIEIIRGAAAAQYGSDAIGGVVNIITRKCRDKPELTLGCAHGSYDTCEGGFALLRPLNNRVRLSMFVNRQKSDGVPIKAPAHRIGNMGFEQCNLLTRLDVDVTESAKVFGWVNAVKNTMDWRGDEVEGYLVTPVVGTSIRLTPSLDFFAQVSYSKWKAEQSLEQNELLQPEMHFTWYISEAHTLTWGVDLKHHKFTRTAAEDTPSQDTYGAFVQHEWRMTDHFTLMTALRYDSVEDIDSVVTPKVSLVYAPDLPFLLRASVARGFHAPTPQELYEEGYGHGGRALRFGNPDLEPEESTTASLGLELFPGSPFEVMLYGHCSDIDDMIVPVYEGPWDQDPSKDVWRRTNIAQARVRGAEIKARYTFSHHCRIEGGYSCTDTEARDSGRQLPYDPGSSAFLKGVVGGRLGTDWAWSGFVTLRAVFGRSAWSWQPAPGAPVDDPTGGTTKLDDYQKLDAGVSVKYRDRYELFVNVSNILGQDIENLDDAYTVLDGEPTLMAGGKAKW